MKKILALVLAMLMVLSLLTACGSKNGQATAQEGSTDASAAAEKKKITIGVTSEPSHLMPLMWPDDAIAEVTGLIYMSLFTNDETGEIINVLAEDYTINEDYTVFTWKIRNDCFWQDGEPVTIDDVIFTLETMAHPLYDGGMSNYVAPIQGAAEYTAGEADHVSGLKRIDDYTLEITLTGTNVSFMSNFSGGGSQLVPKHLLEGMTPDKWLESDYARNPVGNGPYRLGKWEAGQYIELVPNENFCLGEVANGGIIFRYAESASLVSSFINGETDVSAIAHADLDYVAQQEGVSFVSNGTSLSELYFNMLNKHLSKTAIRQAMRYGFNNDVDTPAIYGEWATAGWTTFTPTTHWAHSEDTMKYEYNVEKAKELIESEGYTLGSDGIYQLDGERLSFKCIFPGSDAESYMGLFKQDMAAIGIEINLELVDWSVMVSKIMPDYQPATAEDFDMFTMGGSVSGDPSGSVDIRFASWNLPPVGVNFSQYADDIVDEALAAASVETDHEKRAEEYHTVEERMQELAWTIPLFNKPSWTAVRNGVENFKLMSTETITTTYLWQAYKN